MDAYEATRIVFSRIQTLDPENASKIMGLLLIQDYGEKEMIRLAFGPEALLHSVVVKTRSELGLVGLSSDASSAPISPPSPPSPSPFLSRHNPSSTSRLFGGARGFSLPPSLAIPPPAPSWESPSMYSDFPNSEESSPAASFRPPHSKGSSSDLLDELRFQDQLSFVSDYCSPATRHREMLAAASFPGYGGEAAGNWGGVHHRRSVSVNDVCFGPDDLTSGFGWKPCLYYSRGFCKNGSSCRFLHGCGFENPSGMGLPGSEFPVKPDITDPYPEMLRSKYSQRVAAAALMSGEDMNKFGRFRMECAAGMMSPSSRQIYLTFPADSTFREEDVSNYFSIYGPVQDVRIPYQQKRMFGFVSFVYAETVRIILAKGNPHFVCDARVLVKPYKEKGKVPDKYRKQQQMERFDQFSACDSPTGQDSRDPNDFQLGGRMVYGNQQEMLWRRKMEEQADIQQAIELQTRRLSGLQLHSHPSFSSFTAAQSRTSGEVPQDGCFSPVSVSGVLSKTASVGYENEFTDSQNGLTTGKIDFPREDAGDPKKESLEHILPEHLFSSPKKSDDELASVFSNGLNRGEDQGEPELKETEPASSAPSVPITSSSILLAGSTLGLASLKSCYFPIPSFSPSQETVGV